MNFIAFDFETANAQKHSACSVALIMVQDDKIVGRYYSLIKPETDFHWRNIQVHGIQPEDVVDASTFPEVWEEIKGFFQENRLIVAHNAAFDCNVLKGCLEYYNLEQPHYLSLCTVKTSRKLFPNFENHRLNTVCDYLNITLDNHHNALEDSIACANILLYQAEQFGIEPLKELVKYM
ncbi:3'-5' exonuclease [Vagococcus salmoninarum]|uniref:3'-5' exonuclease n=1 Tax=Vagococcus salmoninarum TaxID=2739 RepID=UPI00187E13DD|nr:3'-5' exonuclease [Vagococcus salmoninarum]MBE9389667.1 3'-5' exonuclease [Vagococcus salmoninarum]